MSNGTGNDPTAKTKQANVLACCIDTKTLKFTVRRELEISIGQGPIGELRPALPSLFLLSFLFPPCFSSFVRRAFTQPESDKSTRMSIPLANILHNINGISLLRDS